MAVATTFVRHPQVLHRHLTDGVLVLAPGASQATALLGTAADLWEVLARPVTAAAAADELAGRYDGDPTTIAADVARALEQLAAVGLVEERR